VSLEWLKLVTPSRAVCVVYSMHPLPNYIDLLFNRLLLFLHLTAQSKLDIFVCNKTFDLITYEQCSGASGNRYKCAV